MTRPRLNLNADACAACGDRDHELFTVDGLVDGDGAPGALCEPCLDDFEGNDR